MSEANRKGGADTAAEQQYTQADLDARLQEQAKQQKTAVDEAKAEGAKEERERISAILGSEEAKARPALAQKLAFSDKGYSAEDASEILQAASEETDSSKNDPLGTAMQGKSPGVSSDDGSAELEGEEAEETALANSIINA
jgi:hypothetical protein